MQEQVLKASWQSVDQSFSEIFTYRLINIFSGKTEKETGDSTGIFKRKPTGFESSRGLNHASHAFSDMKNTCPQSNWGNILSLYTLQYSNRYDQNSSII